MAGRWVRGYTSPKEEDHTSTAYFWLGASLYQDLRIYEAAASLQITESDRSPIDEKHIERFLVVYLVLL